MTTSTTNTRRGGVRLVADQMCGRWMPRKQTHCARTIGHEGACASPESMERARQWHVRKVRMQGSRVESPEVKRQRQKAWRLEQYSLTRAEFGQLLEIQKHACGMCHEPFGEASSIFIDHDHACCPAEKTSCGKCIRGLLCLSCNTTLGHIERNSQLASEYLTNLPGRLVVEAKSSG